MVEARALALLLADLADASLSLDDVPNRCGPGLRRTLLRQLKRHGGAGGQALRERLSAPAAA